MDNKKWLKVEGSQWKMEDNAQNRAMYIYLGKCDVDSRPNYSTLFSSAFCCQDCRPENEEENLLAAASSSLSSSWSSWLWPSWPWPS